MERSGQQELRAAMAGRGDRIDGAYELEWVRAHDLLSALAREHASLEGREAGALLRAFRAGVHLHLGFGSFAEYVERLFGYGARTTEDKLRTAEALEGLPVLDRALQEGRIRWSAAGTGAEHPRGRRASAESARDAQHSARATP